MRMLLSQDGAGPHNFSPVAALIAWSAHLIKPTMRSRQGFRLRQSSLAGRLSGSIHIDHQPRRTCPVAQAAEGRKRRARKQIIVKERARKASTVG